MKAGIAGILLAGFGLWMLVFAARSYRRFGESQKWPTVPGTIESSEVVRYSATSSRHDFLVRYSYDADGQRRTGSRVALYTVSGRDEAEALAARFPVGSEVPVYVEPAEAGAGEAVLVPGPPAEKPLSGVILAGLVVIVGAAVSVGGFLGRLGD
ncbi:MAG: DUF3592 domain-containing protein [Planctomycetota bacterium]